MAIELNENNAELIARRFKALSDPTRLRILYELKRNKEASVGQLTDALGSSQQNVSKHLSNLLAEGFISRRKQGTSAIYAISDPMVLEICDRVSAGMEAQLEAMGAAIRG